MQTGLHKPLNSSKQNHLRLASVGPCWGLDDCCHSVNDIPMRSITSGCSTISPRLGPLQNGYVMIAALMPASDYSAPPPQGGAALDSTQQERLMSLQSLLTNHIRIVLNRLHRWTAACRLLPIAVITILALLPLVNVATAQGVGDWSEVMQLSSDTTFSQSPALTLDQDGLLHAFWSSRPIEDRVAALALSHSALVAGVWLPPMEIVLTPDGGDATIPRAVVDKSNNLHLFWVTSALRGDLYYASAPATEAHSAKGWSAPHLVQQDVYQHDVEVGPDGIVHLVYASESHGICHMALDTADGSWGAVSCFRTGSLRDQEYDSRPSLAIDSRGVLHIVWTIMDLSYASRLPYAGRAVCYARSLDSGLTWETPLFVDEVASRATLTRSQPEYPAIAVDARDWVHIVWIGHSMYRQHAYSVDHGSTWSEVQVAIDAGGYNNWMGLETSGYDLHLVAGSLDGLVYGAWDGRRWSARLDFPDTDGAHYADALTAPDGTLHAVWQDHGGGDATQGHILLISRAAAGAETGATALPSAEQNEPMTRQPTRTDAGSSVGAQEPDAKSEPGISAALASAGPVAEAPAQSVLVALIAATLTIVLVMLARQPHRR